MKTLTKNTVRHSPYIQNALTQINGNLDTFQARMIEGTTVQEGFSTVTNSWANSMDRLNASLKQTNLAGAEFLDRIGKNYINVALMAVDTTNKLYNSSSAFKTNSDAIASGVLMYVPLALLLPRITAGLEALWASLGTGKLVMAGFAPAAIVAGIVAIGSYIYSLGEQELYLSELSAETSLKRAKDLQMVVEQMKINKSMQEQMNKAIEDGMKYSVGGMKDITLFKVSSKYSELKDINDGLQTLKSTITTLPDMSKFNRQIEDLFKPTDKGIMDAKIASLDKLEQAISKLNNIEKPKGAFFAYLNLLSVGVLGGITGAMDTTGKIDANTVIQAEQQKANEVALIWIKADKKRRDAIISGRTESTFSNNKVIPGTKLNVYDYKEDLRKVLKLGDTTKDTEILNAALLSVRGSLIGTSNDIQKINVDKFKTMGDWLEGMNSSLKEIKSNIDSMNFNVFFEMVKKKDFSGIEELKKFSTNSGMPEYTDLIIQASNVTDKFASNSDKLKYLKENLLETFGVIKTLKNQVVGFRETIAGLTSQLTGLESGKKTPENIDAINKAKEEIQRNKDLLLSEKDITEYRRSELMFNIAQQQRKLTGVPKSSEEYKIASKKIADLETEISLTEKNIESYKKLTEYVNLEYLQRVQLTDTYDVEYMNLDKIGKSKQKQLDIDKKIYDLQAKTRIETLESGLAADKYKYKKEYQTYTTTSVGGKVSTTPDAIIYEAEYTRLNKMAIAGQLEEKSGDIEKLAILKKILDGEINISAEHKKGIINTYDYNKKTIDNYEAQLKIRSDIMAIGLNENIQNELKLKLLEASYYYETNMGEKLRIRLELLKTEKELSDKKISKQIELNDLYSKGNIINLESKKLFSPEELQFKIQFEIDTTNSKANIDKIDAEMKQIENKYNPINIDASIKSIDEMTTYLNLKTENADPATKKILEEEILKLRVQKGIYLDIKENGKDIKVGLSEDIEYQKKKNDKANEYLNISKNTLANIKSEYELKLKGLELDKQLSDVGFDRAKFTLDSKNMYGDIKTTGKESAQIELNKAIKEEDDIRTKIQLREQQTRDGFSRGLISSDQALAILNDENTLKNDQLALDKAGLATDITRNNVKKEDITILKEQINLALDAIDKLSTGVTIKFDASASIKNMETSINKILTGTKLEGQDYASLAMGAIGVIDNITKQGYEAQGKNLDRELNNINLRKQLAVTEQQKNEYERQTVEIEKKKIDLELAKNTGFMGVTGAGGSALGGAVSGASTGMAFGIGGAVIGGLLGGLSGLLGGQSAEEQATYAKKQLEEQYQMTLLLQNISKYNDSMSKSLIKLSESSKAFTPEQASNKFLSTQEIKYTNVVTKSQVSLGSFKTKANVDSEIKNQQSIIDKNVSDLEILVQILNKNPNLKSIAKIDPKYVNDINSAKNAILALNGVLSVTEAITKNAKYMNLGFEIKYYDDQGNEIPDISKYTSDMGNVVAIPDFDKKEIEIKMGVISDVAYDVGKESGNLAWDSFRTSFMQGKLPENYAKTIGDKLKVVAEAKTPEAKTNALKDLQDYTDGVVKTTTEANQAFDQIVVDAMSSGVKMSDEYLVKFTTFGKKVVDLKTKMVDPLLANSASGLANAIKDSMKADLTTKMGNMFSPEVMAKLTSSGMNYVDVLSKSSTITRDVLKTLGFNEDEVKTIIALQDNWNALLDKTVVNTMAIRDTLREISGLEFTNIDNIMMLSNPIDLGSFTKLKDTIAEYKNIFSNKTSYTTLSSLVASLAEGGSGATISFENLGEQIRKDSIDLQKTINDSKGWDESKQAYVVNADAQKVIDSKQAKLNAETDIYKQQLALNKAITTELIAQDKFAKDMIYTQLEMENQRKTNLATNKYGIVLEDKSGLSINSSKAVEAKNENLALAPTLKTLKLMDGEKVNLKILQNMKSSGVKLSEYEEEMLVKLTNQQGQYNQVLDKTVENNKIILDSQTAITNEIIAQRKATEDLIYAGMKLAGQSDRQIAVAKAKADVARLVAVKNLLPKYELTSEEKISKYTLEGTQNRTPEQEKALSTLIDKEGKYNSLKIEEISLTTTINRATYTNLTLLDEIKAREEDRISMLEEFINGQNIIAELRDNENASVVLKLNQESRVLALMDAQIVSGGKLSAIYDKLPESTKAMMENMKTINVLEYDSKNMANSMWNTQVKSIREVLKGKVIDVVFATELKDIAYTVAKISNWQVDQAEHKRQIDLLTIKYWKDFYAIIASGKFTDDAGNSAFKMLDATTDAIIELQKLKGVTLEDLAGTLDTQITGLGDKIVNNPLLTKIDTLFGDRTVSTLEQLKSETDKWNEALHQTSLLFIKIPDVMQSIMNMSNDDFMKNLFQFDMTDTEKSADDLKRQLELLSNAELTIQSPFVIDWSDNITDLKQNTLNARTELDKLASKGTLKADGTISFASEADKEAYIKAKEAYDWSEKMIGSALTLKKTAEDTAKAFTSDLWLSEYEKVIEAMYNMSLVGKNQVETLNMQIGRNATLLGQKDAEILKARKLADIEKELAIYSGRVLDENGQLAFATEAEQKIYEKLKAEYSNVISLTVEQIGLEADKLKLIQEQVNVYSIIDKEQSDLNTETKLYIASMMDSRVLHKEITDMLGIQNALISNRSTLEYKSLSFMSQWINSGGKVSEILDSMTELQKNTYSSLKDVFSSTNYTDGLSKLGDAFGSVLKNSLITKLFDSSFASKMVELQSKLQLTISNSFSVNSIQGVANEIMKFTASAELQRNKIQALSDLVNFSSDPTYNKSENQIQYQTGSSSSNTWNYHNNITTNGICVAERSDLNWLAEALVDKITQIQSKNR